MGSEHSHQQQQSASGQQFPSGIRPNPNYPERLTRANTVANPGGAGASSREDGSAFNSPSDSRPVSPPMSICSDSDLPYISYTDKPIGDSPKLRNKGGQMAKGARPNSVIVSGSSSSRHGLGKNKIVGGGGIRGGPGVGSLVVVRQAPKQESIDKDPDLVRLQVSSNLLSLFKFTYLCILNIF